MSNTHIYEQPLNERIRSFLRLEFLFDIIKQRRPGNSRLDTRDAINSMIDVVDLLSRSDIKSELIKELERHINTLSLLTENRNVDQEQLNSLLKDIHKQLSKLHDPAYQPGKLFLNHELISSVKQRSAITGGGCNFDLPNYYYWLQQPVEYRNQLIEELYRDISVIDDSIQLCLHILRNSSSPTKEIAIAGFFQKNLDSNMSFQMLRILLENDTKVFPEISAGKHRFSIRFLSLDNPKTKAIQTTDNISFKLLCCLS